MPQAVSPLFTPQRLAFYGAASVAAASGVVVRAFRERSNFYAAAVWLGRSNGCMLVLLNFGLFVTLLFGKACQAIFFGPLRPTEIEHLYERSWYAVTETLLAMTIFRDEFDGSFIVLFGTLLFLKVFHWLCADRVELMEQSPSVTKLFHARMISVLWTLFCLDLFLVAFAIEVLVMDKHRMGIMIMFASEFMILTATLWATIAKYIINCKDMRSDEPWEAKSMYVSAVDLVTDFLKLATYVCFFCLILTYYGLPLNIVRDVYVTARSFFGRIRDLIRYRAATRNMDTRFPNASHEDLRRTDGTCIICREEMVAPGPDPTLLDSHPEDGLGGPDGPSEQPQPTVVGGRGLNDTPKKLACGHIFHFHCLRAWLERQQSCPTCRRTVFETTPAPPAPTPGHVAQPRPQEQRAAQAAAVAAAAAASATATGVAVPPTAATAPSRGTQDLSSRARASRDHSPNSERGRQRLQGLLDQVLGVERPQSPSSPLRNTVATGQISPGGSSRQTLNGEISPALEVSTSSSNNGLSFNETARRSAWHPPPPSSLQIPTNLDLPSPTRQLVSPGVNIATTPSRSIEAAQDNVVNDPADPRDAARQAALRRFGTVLPSQSSPASRSQSDHRLLQVPTAVLGTPVAEASHLASLLDEATDKDLDTPLSSEEFESLTSHTRRGIQEQLRVVERAQNSLWKVSMELNRALSVIPGGDGEGSMSGGAVEIESEEDERMEAERRTDKGKGREVATVLNVTLSSPPDEAGTSSATSMD